jgi:hypothetical protein
LYGVHFLRKLLGDSPWAARVVPFVIFVLLTFGQGNFGAASAYWFYLAKTLIAVWLIWEMRPLVSEMRWAISWEAVLVGVAVFGLWVGLDGFYPQFKNGVVWNPFAQFGPNSAQAWLMILTRIIGSTLVVPPLEEVFYRSFLYRYFAKPDFLSIPLNRFLPWPFFATAAVFGFSHFQWLAGILCGMAYQWLVLRKNRLGDAITAHAITNFLLGVWVAWQGAWQFW